eukprot:121795-Hanusia_phi.AAC.1
MRLSHGCSRGRGVSPAEYYGTVCVRPRAALRMAVGWDDGRAAFAELRLPLSIAVSFRSSEAVLLSLLESFRTFPQYCPRMTPAPG